MSESPSPHDSLELPSGLSLDSRQRLRKRLQMRRKRALAKGIPASEVPIDTRKLKPGQKSKHKPENAQGGARERLGSGEQPNLDSAVFAGLSLGPMGASPSDHPSGAAPNFLDGTAPGQDGGEKTDFGPVRRDKSWMDPIERPGCGWSFLVCQWVGHLSPDKSR